MRLVGPRSGVTTNFFQLLRIGSVTGSIQAVIEPGEPFESARVRQVEVAFLKFHFTVVLKYNHFPYQDTIMRPPSIAPDSVVRLQLRASEN